MSWIPQITDVDDLEERMNSAQYIASQWNIEHELWYREWATLSGGEAQRIAMAIGLSMRGTEILLLDGGLLKSRRWLHLH